MGHDKKSRDCLTEEVPKVIDPEVFKENFLRLVKERGFSQNDIAKGCGVSQQCVCRWMNYGMPTTKSLYSLRDFLDVEWNELLGNPYQECECGAD